MNEVFAAYVQETVKSILEKAQRIRPADESDELNHLMGAIEAKCEDALALLVSRARDARIAKMQAVINDRR